MSAGLPPGHRGPRAGPVLRAIGRFWLWFFGWRTEGEVPDVPRVVFIAAPHTSGWDLPFTLGVSWALGMRISWVGKQSLFRWPFAGFFRATGGVPVVRDQKLSQVQRISAAMKGETSMFLVIAPSGSRKKMEYWKSGFLHIAREAGVPILFGFLDYSRKVGGVGPAFAPTGDLGADMDTVRAFYAQVKGKHPDRHAVPRLPEEDAPPAAEKAAGG